MLLLLLLIPNNLYSKIMSIWKVNFDTIFTLIISQHVTEWSVLNENVWTDIT